MDHFPKGFHHMSLGINWLTVGFWAAVIAAVYVVARIGLPQFITDIKNAGSNLVSGFKSAETKVKTVV